MEPRTYPRDPGARRPERGPPRPHAHGEDQHRRARQGWHWAKRGFSILFFAAVAALLVRYGRNVDWEDVLDSVRTLPAPALLAAILLAAASHLLYSCFDLIGRRYTGHNLPTRTVMAVNFISYAFNLCIGSIVGGVGFRYRLYSRLGLKPGVITRIVSMSMLTNWLGYKLLAGFLFVVHPLALPPSWHMGNHGLQWIGFALMAVSLGYILACHWYGDRVWTVRGHELYLPPWRMAVLQMLISCINWSLMAGVIYVLLGQKIAYADVLTVLLIGAIAGVVAHVPAGLGVFEFVFVALLSHIVPESRLIGALLGYRAIYYIGPLIVAGLMYLVMEVQAKKQRRALRRAGRV
ncbi:lysylphosphatidylglycerol synthase domain-containing protein [Ramlibacter sp.]|uniref:lysylphosphatidylglycerol synthase domain-containing protein n=1 Tax=Ramlibacter sp. TaxID=1917967 RepID=UPI002BDF3CBA|nr:lysylphosphatidylglycerol synthase domain-containing protein [Ramlibacter sp.]HWI83514.1 lysylphosphatidylglycerol synthase domain-containing protein [Ramlibacter sp.]